MHKLALNLTTGPSFEPRFPMLIVNGSSVGYEGNCRENRWTVTSDHKVNNYWVSASLLF